MTNAHDNTWICICRPDSLRVQRLYPEYFEDPDDSDEGMDVSCGSTGKCVCELPASAKPEHKWIVTKKGLALGHDWWTEQAERNQYNYGMLITRKWNGYGISEVIENMVRCIISVTAWSKPNRS